MATTTRTSVKSNQAVKRDKPLPEAVLKRIKVLNGLEKQYICLAACGKGIDAAAKMMGMDGDEVALLRESAIKKLSIKPYN